MTWGEPATGRPGASLIVLAAFGFALSTPLAPLVYGAGGTPAVVMVVRGVLITATIGTLFLWRGRRPPPVAGDWPWLLVAATAFAGQGLCYLASVAFIPVSLAALLFFTWPVAVAVIAPLLGAGRWSPLGMACVVAAFAGLTLALAPDFAALDRRGVLLALGGAAIMVVYVFAVRRLSAGADGITVTLIVAAGSTVVAGLATTWRGDWTLPAGWPGWLALTVLSLAASAAMAAMVLGLARTPPGRAALLFNLEPVLSILLAAAVLGEVLTPTQYLGGLLAIGAVALGGRPPREGGKKQDE